VEDVVFGLGLGERVELVVDEDSLTQLAEAVLAELLFELGLAHQDDLKELLLVGLQVGEEADLLKDLEGEVLALVDDEDDVLAGVDSRHEDAVDLRNEGVLGAILDGLAELEENSLEHLGLGDAGVEDERGLEAGRVELVEEPAAQGGFSATDFSDENYESLALLDAIFEVLERVDVRRAQIEKLRVRGDVEGHLRETVEALVHRTGWVVIGKRARDDAHAMGK